MNSKEIGNDDDGFVFHPFLSAAKASQTSSLQLQSEAAKNGS